MVAATSSNSPVMALLWYTRYPLTGAAAVPLTASHVRVMVAGASAAAFAPDGIAGTTIGVFVAEQPVPTGPFPDALNATTEIGYAVPLVSPVTE